MSRFSFQQPDSSFQRERGHSLLELLVAVSIVGLIVVATTALLASSLRATRKSATIAEVKQNGDAALIAMERVLRQATELYVPDCTELGNEDVDPPIYFETRSATGAREYLSIEQVGAQLVLNQYADSTFSGSGTLVRNFTTDDVEVASGTFLVDCLDSRFKRDRVKLRFELSLVGIEGADDSRRRFHAAVMLRNK